MRRLCSRSVRRSFAAAALVSGALLLAQPSARAEAPGGIEIICDVDRNEFRAGTTGQTQTCFSLWTAEFGGASVGGLHCMPLSDVTAVPLKTERLAGERPRSFVRVNAAIGSDDEPVVVDATEVWLQMHVGGSVLGCDIRAGATGRRRLQSVLFARRSLAGVACWDVEDNGVCDLATEDMNGDGDCTAEDCEGPPGPVGPQGPSAMPAGSILPYAGSLPPAGWLPCDGSVVSRTEFAALFAVVGTTFGAGDGSSTFQLPDLRGRSAVGRGVHADVDALGESEGLAVASRTPSHAHVVDPHRHVVDNHSHHVEIWSGGEAFSYWSSGHRYPKANYDNFAHGHAVIGETWGAAPGTSWEAPGTSARSGAFLTTTYVIKY